MRSFLPNAESLESRIALSGAGHSRSIQVRPHHNNNNNAPVVVDLANFAGSMSGTVTRHVVNANAGATYNLSGSGALAGLKQTRLVGEIDTPANTPNARASGQFTLSNARGAVILRLDAPPGGSQDLAGTYTYSVWSGSGSYQNVQGSGTITAVSTGAGKFRLTIQPGGRLG